MSTVKLTVEFTIKHLVSGEDLLDGNNVMTSLLEHVRWLLQEEGIGNIIEEDNYTILSAEFVEEGTINE